MNKDTLGGHLRLLIRDVAREVLAEIGQDKPEQLHDINETSKILSIPKRWLYEKTAKNEIPCHRLGKYLRFSDSDIRAISGGARGER